MAVQVNKVMTFGDTVDLITKVHKASANPVAVAPHYDGTKGEYDNLGEWFSLRRDGKVYGVDIPEYTYSNDPKGIKTRDNVGLVCQPATNTTAGRDDYSKLNAFEYFTVNGTVDDGGKFHCTAMKGDGRFRADGSNGDVWVMACPGYYSITRSNGYKRLLYSDTKYEGMRPLPGQKYADGTERPLLVFSPYLAWCDSNNVPHSYSGKVHTFQFGSHDTGISYSKKKGAGYTGRTVADNFYIQLMLMLKYATQDLQSLGGCTDYANQYKVLEAETGVNRVLLPKAAADYFLVGSTLNCGPNSDRGATAGQSTFAYRTVTKIETMSDRCAVYVDGAPFTTAVDDYVSAMPWKTGTCDNLLGTDGYPIAGKPKQRQPYRIQGIEVLCGAYEPLCDVIVNQVKTSADEGHCELYKCFDSRKYSSALDANHVKLDLELPARDSKTNDQWMYNEDWQESAKCPGFLVPTGSKGTSTTGTCDAIYSNPISSPACESCGASAFSGMGLCAVPSTAFRTTGSATAGGTMAVGYLAWGSPWPSHGAGVKRKRGGSAPSSPLPGPLGVLGGSRSVLGLLQCFGNLRNGSMYGAFYGNSNNRLGNYRWNYGGRKSGQTRNTLVESTRFERACPVN